jgi:hypothetical protein
MGRLPGPPGVLAFGAHPTLIVGRVEPAYREQDLHTPCTIAKTASIATRTCVRVPVPSLPVHPSKARTITFFDPLDLDRRGGYAPFFNTPKCFPYMPGGTSCCIGTTPTAATGTSAQTTMPSGLTSCASEAARSRLNVLVVRAPSTSADTFRRSAVVVAPGPDPAEAARRGRCGAGGLADGDALDACHGRLLVTSGRAGGS